MKIRLDTIWSALYDCIEFLSHLIAMSNSIRFSLLVVGLSLGFFAFGCSSGNEVRGTAVVEGEYSRRFIPADMTVKIIDEKEMLDFQKRKTTSIKSSVDSLDGQRRTMRENLDKLGDDIADGRRTIASGNAMLAQANNLISGASNIQCEVDGFTNELDCSARDARIAAARSRVPAAKAMIGAGNKKVAEGEVRLANQNEALQKVERTVIESFAAKSLLENLPTAIATSVVDSYGDFVIEIPKGRYALVATGPKNDLAIEEELLWMFWIDVTGEGITKISLHKDNVLLADFDQSVFRVKDFVEKSSTRQ